MKPQFLLLTLVVLYALTGATRNNLVKSRYDPVQMEKNFEELSRRTDHAGRLADQGKYKQALDEYLWIYDNGDEYDFGPVKDSFLLGDIKRLGDVYPPAHQALRQRRDAIEKAILQKNPNSSVPRKLFEAVQSYTAINRELGEKKRSVDLYDKLKTQKPPYVEAIDDLLTLIWLDLVEVRRYNDLNGKIAELTQHVFDDITMYQKQQKQVSEEEPELSGDMAFTHLQIVENGGPAYETLLALGRNQEADQLARRILQWKPTDVIYAFLMRHAIRAYRYNVARTLAEEARKTLTAKEDLKEVIKMEKRIPKIMPTASTSPAG